MARGIKRAADIEDEGRRIAASISKASWVELYRDLYLQTHGEDTGADWVDDAKKRAEILALNRGERVRV